MTHDGVEEPGVHARKGRVDEATAMEAHDDKELLTPWDATGQVQLHGKAGLGVDDHVLGDVGDRFRYSFTKSTPPPTPSPGEQSSPCSSLANPQVDGDLRHLRLPSPWRTLSVAAAAEEETETVSLGDGRW